MKRLLYIMLIVFMACEEIILNLPDSQNLIVVEGWIIDSIGNQPIHLTRSNGFSSENQIQSIQDAQIIVESQTSQVHKYSYSENGYYVADTPYQGITGVEYRVRILVGSKEIRSDWNMMPEKVSIENLEINSFEKNDPDNRRQRITIFYPKIVSMDSKNIKNYYRWVFLKNDDVFTGSESITVQNDRLFDGNQILNNFENFEYSSRDKVTVQLQSISSKAFNYLSQLKSQITTLGTSSGTTPAIVSGNLNYLNEQDQRVLGFFGAVAISVESTEIP